MKAALNCPACSEPMVTMVDRQTGLEIDSCSRCFGLWFDGNELSALFPSRSLASRVLHEPAQSQVVPVVTENRGCPRCQKALRQAQVDQVTVDVCPQCKGIWFDAGEIQKVTEAARLGLHGDPEVIEQMTLGRALEGVAGLSPQADPLAALLDRLMSHR